ncbi:MAG: RNA polymerase sigma factor [Candidatus Falkowbacteria bacterium]
MSNISDNSFFSSDKNLLLRLKKYKDKEAFLEAYQSYAEDIYRFLYFKVGGEEDARDLTSAVFVKAWSYVRDGRLKDEENYKSLRAFLYKIARNEAIDFFRAKKAVTFTEASLDGQTADIASSQDLLAEAAQGSDNEALKRHLAHLKSEYQSVLVMYYINELSISEIASALGKSKGNVRVTVFRSLKALRELMEQE